MFLIRADGNAKIGAGHLMRCMTIAWELTALHGRNAVCFVCADEQSGELVRENGFPVHVLGTDYRQPEQELSRWPAFLREFEDGEEQGRVILADSYFVTDRYLEELRRLGRVAILDDMGMHRYPADCVINYNAQADREHYSRLYEGEDCRLLIGSSYVPVRKQFVNTEYSVSESVRNVLITAGGGDVDNIAGKILDRLLDRQVVFHLVTGRFNPHLDRLKQLENQSGSVHIYHDVKDMAGLMKSCDMAVTAGGSTVYELAAIGVPFVCFSCAENQEPLTDYLGAQGIAEYAGAWHRDPEETLGRLTRLFDGLAGSRERRTACNLRERDMIDGKGAKRLAAALCTI